MRVEDAALGVGAHRGRQRRLHENAVVHVAAIQPLDQREQSSSDAVAGSRSRSARSPASAADFSLPRT